MERGNLLALVDFLAPLRENTFYIGNIFIRRTHSTWNLLALVEFLAPLRDPEQRGIPVARCVGVDDAHSSGHAYIYDIRTHIRTTTYVYTHIHT